MTTVHPEPTTRFHHDPLEPQGGPQACHSPAHLLRNPPVLPSPLPSTSSASHHPYSHLFLFSLIHPFSPSSTYMPIKCLCCVPHVPFWRCHHPDFLRPHFFKFLSLRPLAQISCDSKEPANRGWELEVALCLGVGVGELEKNKEPTPRSGILSTQTPAPQSSTKPSVSRLYPYFPL